MVKFSDRRQISISYYTNKYFILHYHTSILESVPGRSEARGCVKESTVVVSLCNKGMHFQISCGGGGVVWHFIKIRRLIVYNIFNYIRMRS